MDLLIVGNGLDKHCGLPSSFSDYINEIEKQSPFVDIQNNIEQNLFFKYSPGLFSLNYKKISLWEILIFLNESNNLLWADIEQTISKYLRDDTFLKKIELGLEKQKNTDISMKDKLVLSEGEKFLQKIIRKKYLGKFEIEKSHRGIIKILFEELKIFEENFSQYLSSKISADYEGKLYNFFLRIDRYNYNVMSFNYTPIKMYIKQFEDTSSRRPHLSKCDYVHGELANEQDQNKIIIGIDSKNIKHEEEIYEFTKTSRRVTKLINENWTLKRKEKEYESVLQPDIERIIFYGHSLGEQDYSYFQTIFDYVRLYESKVILVFLFSYFEDENVVKEKTSKAIIKLIETYGSTFRSEPDKGKNLLHKLLNENRLMIMELDNFYKDYA